MWAERGDGVDLIKLVRGLNSVGIYQLVGVERRLLVELLDI